MFITADNLFWHHATISGHKFYPDSPGALPVDPVERRLYLELLHDGDWIERVSQNPSEVMELWC
jgi:hypothetical protein